MSGELYAGRTVLEVCNEARERIKSDFNFRRRLLEHGPFKDTGEQMGAAIALHLLDILAVQSPARLSVVAPTPTRPEETP